MKYHPGLTLEDVFRQALAIVGPDRLIFGSDSSFFPRGWQRQIFELQKQTLDRLGVPEDAQERIFSGNFQRLFPGRVAGTPVVENSGLCRTLIKDGVRRGSSSHRIGIHRRRRGPCRPTALVSQGQTVAPADPVLYNGRIATL